MSLHFTEDLHKFFTQTSEKTHHPAIARAASNFSEDLRAVCSDVDHLSQNPHMLRICCPPMRRLPKDASSALKAAHDAQVDHCFRANVGWGYDRKTNNEADKQRMAFETRRRQKVVDIVTDEACKDSDFARAHADACCVSPGFNLGFPGDSQPVARACGLAQL